MLTIGPEAAHLRVQVEFDRTLRPVRSDCLDRVGAERCEGNGLELESDRPREVQHVSDDTIEPNDFLIDVGHRPAYCRRWNRVAPECPQHRLDNHQ